MAVAQLLAALYLAVAELLSVAFPPARSERSVVAAAAAAFPPPAEALPRSRGSGPQAQCGAAGAPQATLAQSASHTHQVAATASAVSTEALSETCVGHKVLDHRLPVSGPPAGRPRYLIQGPFPPSASTTARYSRTTRTGTCTRTPTYGVEAGYIPFQRPLVLPPAGMDVFHRPVLAEPPPTGRAQRTR